MKKAIVGVLLVISSLFIFTGLFADVRITKSVGNVTVYQNNIWNNASIGMAIGQQDKIKTGPVSRAELLLDGESKIWVNENSEVEVNSLGAESIFKLILGKIRNKIKLAKGGKFTVKTPVSVCAVRGTEFVASDKGEIYVLEGNVDFSNGEGTDNTNVGEGQGTAIGEKGIIPQPAPLTNEQKIAMEQEWSGFDEDAKQEGSNIDKKEEKKKEKTQEEAKKDILKDEIQTLKQELIEIVNNIKSEAQATREIANEIKEADFATGRTLKDIHGNVVRVEQQLIRPDSQTMQFLNFTKRDGYVYNGKFKYDGTSGNRLDVLETKVTFNKRLPEQLTEWPGFIANQDEDTFYPQSVYVRLTNQTDTIESIGESRAAGQLDNDGKVLKDRTICTNNYITTNAGKWKFDENYDALDNAITADGEDAGNLWSTAITPKIKLDGVGDTSGTKYIYMFTESYAINNNGKLLNLNDFTNTSKDPFTLMKEVAAEGIISAREGNTISSPSFFSKGNLDLVITPDIVIAIATKLATQAGEIADSVK